MRRGLLTDRTPAIGGRGFRITYVEAEVQRLFFSAHGPVGVWMDGTVGPAVVQEAKRLAPVSPDGSNGRPSGYLRSSIGQELRAARSRLYLEIGSHALSPDGFDYGLAQELGPTPGGRQFRHTPHLVPALDVLR